MIVKGQYNMGTHMVEVEHCREIVRVRRDVDRTREFIVDARVFATQILSIYPVLQVDVVCRGAFDIDLDILLCERESVSMLRQV